ncbi:hypothetical protein ACTXT7_002807 [Hymenolepis weldensis]
MSRKNIRSYFSYSMQNEVAFTTAIPYNHHSLFIILVLSWREMQNIRENSRNPNQLAKIRWKCIKINLQVLKNLTLQNAEVKSKHPENYYENTECGIQWGSSTKIIVRQILMQSADDFVTILEWSDSLTCTS